MKSLSLFKNNLFFLVSLIFLNAPAHSAELKIVVKKIPVEQGRLIVTLCDSEKCHESISNKEPEKSPISVEQKVSFMRKKGTMEVVVPNIRSGYYSVFLLQDKNEDGEANFSGLLPAEPFGISRLESFPWTGSPSFDESKVFVSESTDANVVDINLL